MNKQVLFQRNNNEYDPIKYTNVELAALARFLWDLSQFTSGEEILEGICQSNGCGGEITHCTKDNGFFPIDSLEFNPPAEIRIPHRELIKIVSQWNTIRKRKPPYIILTQEGNKFHLEGSSNIPEHLQSP